MFTSDIHNLLKMGDMWANRTKPVPLDFEEIRRGGVGAGAGADVPKNSSTNADADVDMNGAAAVSAEGANGANGASGADGGSKLKDQKQLSVKECLELFVDR